MSWDIGYYQEPSGRVPGGEFLDGLPTKIRAKFIAVLDAVAAAPPPQFSGGGYWEAMHGVLTGFHEVRADEGRRAHHRLFCLLENASAAELERRGLNGPVIVVLAGMTKPARTTFELRDYERVLDIGNEYRSTLPRRLV